MLRAIAVIIIAQAVSAQVIETYPGQPPTALLKLRLGDLQKQLDLIYESPSSQIGPSMSLKETVTANIEELVEEIKETQAALDKIKKSEDRLVGGERGFMQLNTSGSLSTNVQLLKIRIGEPDKWEVPFYLFVGSTSLGSGGTAPNASFAADLINPLGGVLNVSSNIYWRVFHPGEITHIALAGFGGFRVLRGTDQSDGEGKLASGIYADLGIYAQTGAWTEDGYKPGGLFWLEVKLFGQKSDRMEAFLGEGSKLPNGIRVNGGIKIKDKVNIKATWFNPFSETGVPNINTKGNAAFSVDYEVFSL